MNQGKTRSNQSIARLALLGVVLALTAPASWAQFVFTQPQKINSSDGSTGNSEQLIAVDNLGNINVVWVEPTSANNIMFSRSTDGGLTFSAPVNLSNNPGGAFEPSLALDASGNINLAWTGSANFASGPNDIFFTRSTDGGNSFSTPVDVSGGQPAGGGFTPSLALDTAGNPNLVWSGCFDLACSANSSVFFSRSNDRGATFSAPVQVSNDQTQIPQVVVDPSGNIDVVWYESVNGGGFLEPVLFSQSSDGGATFSTPVTVSGTTFFPSLEKMVVDSSGNIYIIENLHPNLNASNRDVWLAASHDGGATFSMTNLSNNPGSDAPDFGQIAVDSAGNIDVVWVNQTQTALVFRRSTDGGATFSNPVTLPRSSSGFLDQPQIAVDPNGDISIVWEQKSPVGFFDVLVSRSTDGGSTFSLPQTISQDQGNSKFPMIAVDSLGIYAVWQDDAPYQGSQHLWNVLFSRGVAPPLAPIWPGPQVKLP